MFLVNSRLGLFSATTLGSRSKSLHHCGYPYPEVTVHFAEFLNEVLPRTLGFSPRIPVSVYGTGGSFLTRSFSRQLGSIPSEQVPSTSRLSLSTRICLCTSLHACTRSTILARTCLPASLHRSNDCCRYWNINQLSISYAPCLGLGPDLP